MIVIDSRDKRPIYEQVVDKLSDLMLVGVLSPGDKLPSVRSLAIGSLTATDSLYKPQTLIKTGFQSYFLSIYYLFYVAICSYLWYNMNMEVEYYEAYCK